MFYFVTVMCEKKIIEKHCTNINFKYKVLISIYVCMYVCMCMYV